MIASLSRVGSPMIIEDSSEDGDEGSNLFSLILEDEFPEPELPECERLRGIPLLSPSKVIENSPQIYLTLVEKCPVYLCVLPVQKNEETTIHFLMRCAGSHFVNASTLLVAGSVESSRERSFVLSLEKDRKRIKQREKSDELSLDGSWVPLHRARALASTCALSVRLGVFLSNNLPSLFPCEPEPLLTDQPKPEPQVNSLVPKPSDVHLVADSLTSLPPELTIEKSQSVPTHKMPQLGLMMPSFNAAPPSEFIKNVLSKSHSSSESDSSSDLPDVPQSNVSFQPVYTTKDFTTKCRKKRKRTKKQSGIGSRIVEEDEEVDPLATESDSEIPRKTARTPNHVRKAMALAKASKVQAQKKDCIDHPPSEGEDIIVDILGDETEEE